MPPRMVPRAFRIGALGVGFAAIPLLTGPFASSAPRKPAGTGERKLPATRAGAYDVEIDPVTFHAAAPASIGAAAVPPSVTLGLRIRPAAREDGLRFAGIDVPLTLVDDLGRTHRAAALPADATTSNPRDYRLRLLLPDDRTTHFESIEGALNVSDAPTHRVELSAGELTRGAEQNLGEYRLKLEPVRSGAVETEIRLSLSATLPGKAVTRALLQPPTLVVDLGDDRGRVYPTRSGRFTYSAQGGGFGTSLGTDFSGEIPPRLTGALLAAAAARGNLDPQTRPFPARWKTPFPADVATRYESTLKFAAVPHEARLQSVAVYLMLPPTTTKALPFRITQVPLPLPEGQQQP